MELEGRGIDYALCGGVALAIHGAPRASARPQDIADVQRLEELARG